MSAHMKMRLTKKEIKIQIGERNARLYIVPNDRAEGVARLLQDFEVKEDEHFVSSREPIKDLLEKYTEPGVTLKGARTKAGLTQEELAAKLKIPQSHISDMEHGRRSISKKMAQRLAIILEVGYKVFL